jgi:hypothetical protein
VVIASKQLTELTNQSLPNNLAQVPSINTQGNATVVAGAPVAGQTVPAARRQGHATAEAKTSAPESGFKNRFSRNYIPELPLNHLLDVKFPINHSAAIERIKGAIKQIPKPIYENRIKDFVRGERFKTWLTSDSSDALVVNNDSVNLSPAAKGVSLLTEITLLLHAKLSILPKGDEAFTFMYLCAQWPETIGKMTTMRRMSRYLTSELYVNDCERWDKQDFVREYVSKNIHVHDPKNDKGDEKNHLLIHLFIKMLEETQQGQVVYILIDGFDLVERDEPKVNQEDCWQFLTCVYDLFEYLNNLDRSRPVLKLFITYHETCPDTRSYWKDFAADLPEQPRTA